MRYFIGFLITVGLIILLIVMLFRGGDKTSTVQTTTKTLVSYAEDGNTDVRLTIEGPINSQQEHVQTRITVGNSNANIDLIRGYNNDVVNQQNFASTDAAYTSFLLALSRAGFTQGNTAEEGREDRGVCPLGNRYIYEIIQNGQSLQRFWSTSCDGPSTYQGNAALTIDLFEAQIPNFNDNVGQDFPS